MTALGSFSTAAKAALCYAQQCAAKKAEAAKLAYVGSPDSQR
jgi:hypothetical protein